VSPASQGIDGRDKQDRDVGVKAAQLFDLSGTVALVTGASGGLGGRFVRALAANGGRVAAAVRAPERLAGLLAEVARSGGTAGAFRLDVTDRQSIASAFEAIEAQWGRATLLVNNAGIAHSGRATEVTPETWRNVMDVDLDGAFFVMQEFARRLIAAETPGVIVNIASVIGIRAEKGAVAYTAAKAGLIQLTRALALEWARYRIRVNALAPGWFPTAINRDYLASEAGDALRKKIPMRRFGEEGDLDGALLLLASDASAFMTGATIVVDGGEAI
jgi:NAD(P)-dependent dehydrogenase (short-subunit alcohol dehydrogenase family)